MINTLIFDFGDVFINLDKEGAMSNALELFSLNHFPDELIATNNLYEQGLISTDEFLSFYLNNFPQLKKHEVVNAWNYILLDFPKKRLQFIKQLAEEKKYKLILLSNTNELHIKWIKNNIPFYDEFKNCFDAFYLSHEIQLRKPEPAIFNFVLDKHALRAEECLFIDDTKENTDAASLLAINVWNNDPKTEDVTNLFTLKKELF